MRSPGFCQRGLTAACLWPRVEMGCRGPSKSSFAARATTLVVAAWCSSEGTERERYTVLVSAGLTVCTAVPDRGPFQPSRWSDQRVGVTQRQERPGGGAVQQAAGVH
jgi:hypothetical protein